MNTKSILRMAGLLVGLAAGQAPAQTAAPQSRQTDVQPPASQGQVAHVAHRQPRAADVPATADNSPNSPLRETPEEAELNRMMRNICRGC